LRRMFAARGAAGTGQRGLSRPAPGACRVRSVPTSLDWSDRACEAAISRRALSGVAAGRLLRRAGQAVLRAPIAGRADRDVPPGRSGPTAIPSGLKPAATGHLRTAGFPYVLPGQRAR
jgi:hypothetical protein